MIALTNNFVRLQKVLPNSIMPYQDPDNNEGTTPSEFEELEDGNDINPKEGVPDEGVNYPDEDEILNDDPFTEIDEPTKREFDEEQQFPGEGEETPYTTPSPDRLNERETPKEDEFFL
jgi:hypothetical protein